MKKLILSCALLALPTLASAQGLGEILQGLIDPHVVVAVGYNQDTHKYSAILTANVVGPKLGELPCYISGAGVSLSTIAPGLENAPIAAMSLPFLTCAPFGEQVALQGGMAMPLNGGGFGNTYYAGAGISVGGGPAALKVKRVKRAEAKAAKKRAELLLSHPTPASGQ